MQRLEYSPGEFIYTTNAAPLESLALTRPVDPFASLSSDQKALLHHFLNDASQITACHSGMQQNICKMLVPMALQTPSLLYATMALSAIHLQDLHNQSTDVKSVPDIARLMAFSLEHFRKELQNPGDKSSDALLATARTLCLAEIHSGAIHPNSWRAHIEGAKALMVSVDSQGGVSPRSSDGFRRYLDRWYRSIVSLTALTGNGPPIGQVSDQSGSDDATPDYLDDYWGFTVSLSAMFREIGAAAWRNQQSRHNETTEGTEITAHNEAAALESSLRHLMEQGAEAQPAFYPGVVEGLSAESIQQLMLCNEAFQHSALIQIHRRLRHIPASAPQVQQSVKRILECTTQIGPSSGLSPWVLLTTPLFIAGCEARGEDRDQVRQLLSSLHSTIHIPNVLQSLKFLQQYWADQLNEDEGWSQYLEWKLPGYGRTSSKSRAATPGNIVAGQTRGSQPTTTYKRPTLSTASPIAMPSANAQRAKSGQRATRGSGNLRSRRVYTPAAPDRPSRLFRDSQSKSRWRSNDEPTATSTLSRGTPFGTRSRWFEVFENISRKTGAHIKAPGHTDEVIQIWGESSQVTAAQQLLQSLVDKCSFSAPTKKEWPKIPAESSKREARNDLKERHELNLIRLRKEPESDSTFPEKLLFMWPKEGPPLEQSLGRDLETLDVIRVKFNCHIFVPKTLPDYICALSHSHDIMKQIVSSLRTKWAETMANTNIKAKVYLVEPPSPEAIRDKITVKKETSLGKPLLHGDNLNHLELANWRDRAVLMQSKNNARLLEVIEKSLKGVVFVRGHIRMRVNLGSFVLDEYRIPPNEKKSYSFEEFREMLSYEQTKGRLIPKCQETTILEPLDGATTSLVDIEPAYSVNFEFMGSNNAMLRLEVEFARRPHAREYEITQRRWLRLRKGERSIDKQPTMQIGVVDFERSDWQIEIKSLEFHEASSIDSALKAFSHSVGFHETASKEDIFGPPRRKVIFKDSPPISRIVEKTAFHYQLKGTNYILEIARYDTYGHGNLSGFQQAFGAGTGGHPCQSPSTSWGASIFDPNWDNLFGEHAHLPVGQSAKYNPDPNTFFPPKDTMNAKGRGGGLWEFIDLVKQAAELLGPKGYPGGQENVSSKPLLSIKPNRIANGSPEQTPGHENSLLIDVSEAPDL
ncbi:hypothetical protein FE257_007541 [Aspergillus nanangensis]|uniref:DUF7905 domain-containing protein n=1 Tax=Aspergillus nanangensis TaxID=2582783 RepID=A0AAD4GV92_ASPNN|nr:hypothetical protein FE257_007541 [Aspergillus nanangensis]